MLAWSQNGKSVDAVLYVEPEKCTCTADSRPVPSHLQGIPLMTAAWTHQHLLQGSPPRPTGRP